MIIICTVARHRKIITRRASEDRQENVLYCDLQPGHRPCTFSYSVVL